MSVRDSQNQIEQGIIRRINSQPEKLISKTRDFRIETLSRVREISENLENRSETHPDTEIRLHSIISDNNNRSDIRMIADSIALLERNNNIQFTNNIREKINLKDNSSKKIVNNTLAAEKKINNHLTDSLANYDVKKDIIILHHLPLELQPTEYPKILEPLVKYIFEDSISLNQFEDTLVHEMSHSWLSRNSKLKKSSVESLQNENLDMAKVTSNNDLYIVDECFANLTGWAVSGKRPTKATIGDYPEPEKIIWGTKILIEKARNLHGVNIIDWARKTEKRVFDKILQKGQTKHSPMEFLLEAAIPEKSFRKIRKLEEIVDDEVKVAFQDFKRSLKDIEKAKLDIGQSVSYEIVDRVEDEVDWHNPEKMKSGLLERIIEKGVENRLSLGQVRDEIDRIIVNEAGKMKEYANNVGRLEAQINNEELDKELDQSRRELLQAAEDIDNIA